MGGGEDVARVDEDTRPDEGSLGPGEYGHVPGIGAETCLASHRRRRRRDPPETAGAVGAAAAAAAIAAAACSTTPNVTGGTGVRRRGRRG